MSQQPPPPTPIIIEVDEPMLTVVSSGSAVSAGSSKSGTECSSMNGVSSSSVTVSLSSNSGAGCSLDGVSSMLMSSNSGMDCSSNGLSAEGYPRAKSSLKQVPPTMTSGSLLGADLFQKPASLAMPPPSLTKVKKARNLVNPGMSMVKWMKLQDTRERPPTRRKIPLSEIAKHNTESDCWMVIRNCVYDVTEYLPYHPGGIPELMKGAGKDATSLFNEVHRWVNFDSILKSCLLGYLGESFDEMALEAAGMSQKSLVPLSFGKPSTSMVLPSTKFSENESLLIFQVETSTRDDDELSEDNWCVSILNRERFLLKVILKPPDLWMAHVKLLQSLNDDSLAVSFQNSFRRAVITFRKPSIGTWKSLGLPLQNNNRLLDSRETQMDDFCVGTLVEKEQITRDVFLFGIKPASSSVLGVPVGFHLKLQPHQSDVDVPARKYTPVCRRLFTDNSSDRKSREDEESSKVLYFIIKIYPDGQLTKVIGALEVNSSLELGGVAGRYDHSFLKDCNTLALFAGGSGITPFARIVNFLGSRKETYPISHIILVFFNHTEDDIIWRDQWAQLESNWKNFHFFPVISTFTETWGGLTGRVDNASLFQNILIRTFTSEKGIPPVKLESELGTFKAMICGSSGFNDACVTMLKSKSFAEISVTDEDVFIF